VLVCLVDFATANGVLLLVMLFYGITPPATVVYLPAVLLVHVAFTTGVGLFVAMANLFYRDVKYLFEVTLTAWMFATSVVYPISLMGGRTARALHLNPMTPIVEGYRAVMITGDSPFTPWFGISAAVSLVILVWAWILFHRAEYSFAERV
jgi:ABC-type polysaccharide/polyol phosphate export permease